MRLVGQIRLPVAVITKEVLCVFLKKKYKVIYLFVIKDFLLAAEKINISHKVPE